MEFTSLTLASWYGCNVGRVVRDDLMILDVGQTLQGHFGCNQIYPASISDHFGKDWVMID